MHPILANPKWLGLYVLGWLPVGLLLAAGIGRDGGWVTAALLLVPLTLLHAFIGLSSWYVCRSFPIERGLATWRAALTLVVAGAWAALLDSFPGGTGAVRLYDEQRALLTVVGGLLFLVAAGVHYWLIAFEEMQAAEQQAVELKLLARNAELKALRMQIDPHFLFNSLHSISALTTGDPPVARRMCVLLADFLRDTLRLGGRAAIPLADELLLVERYLEIEQVRLGPRLQATIEADPATADCLVPPLLLQPVVENAIVHGVGHLLEGGAVQLATARHGASLRICVTNPCDPERPKSAGAGLGLGLLRKRLATQFGSDASLQVQEADGRFQVVIQMPMVRPDAVRGDDHGDA